MTSLMLAVDDALVLRRINREPWLTHATELIGREAETLALLESTPVPAPRLVAHAAPRLLMTRLPGRLRLSDPPLDALARTLVTIHRVDARPRPYQSWVQVSEPPEWSDQDLWRWALDVVARPAPPYAGCFLHRDYHQGNVLFDGDEVTGVVDWVETSFGPADLDVAHCCTNLALRAGLDAVDEFRAAYVRAGGTLSGDLYWPLLDVCGMLGSPAMTADWRARLEAYARSLRAAWHQPRVVSAQTRLVSCQRPLKDPGVRNRGVATGVGSCRRRRRGWRRSSPAGRERRSRISP